MMKTRKYTINDMDYNVAVNSFAGDTAEVTVNGVTYQVKIGREESEGVSMAKGAAPVVDKTPAPETVSVPSAPAVSAGTGKPVTSPLPGVIVEVKVKIGDSVKEGQVVAVLEAMKMENEIQSEYTGTVISINVSQGDSIPEGAPIVTIG